MESLLIEPSDAPCAVESVYSTNWRDVNRFLLRLGLDGAEAENIAQDAFLTAFRRQPDTEKPSHLFGWVLVCAKRLAFKRFRHSRREQRVSNDVWTVWESVLADPRSNVESVLDERQRAELFRQAIRIALPVHWMRMLDHR